jgi:hypothetical protein
LARAGAEGEHAASSLARAQVIRNETHDVIAGSESGAHQGLLNGLR